MSLASDWHERHGAVRKRSRLLLYVFLLVVTFFLMTRAGSIVERISAMFEQTSEDASRDTVVTE